MKSPCYVIVAQRKRKLKSKRNILNPQWKRDPGLRNESANAFCLGITQAPHSEATGQKRVTLAQHPVSTGLLGTRCLILRNPPFHSIHSHRHICETQFIIQTRCIKNSMSEQLCIPRVRDWTSLKTSPHPLPGSQAGNTGPQSPKTPQDWHRRVRSRYRSINCGSGKLDRHLSLQKQRGSFQKRLELCLGRNTKSLSPTTKARV